MGIFLKGGRKCCLTEQERREIRDAQPGESIGVRCLPCAEWYAGQLEEKDTQYADRPCERAGEVYDPQPNEIGRQREVPNPRIMTTAELEANAHHLLMERFIRGCSVDEIHRRIDAVRRVADCIRDGHY